MNNHNLLYDGQYGFRAKFSTINAITDLTGNILKSLDNKEHTVGVILKNSYLIILRIGSCLTTLKILVLNL